MAAGQQRLVAGVLRLMNPHATCPSAWCQRFVQAITIPISSPFARHFVDFLQQDGSGQCDLIAGGVDESGIFKGIYDWSPGHIPTMHVKLRPMLPQGCNSFSMTLIVHTESQLRSAASTSWRCELLSFEAFELRGFLSEI